MESLDSFERLLAIFFATILLLGFIIGTALYLLV